MGDLYAIVGIAKLKTIGNIEAVKAHMLRTRYTANSNGKENVVLIQPPTLTELQKTIKEYIPRKNAVIAYDFLCAASPEFFVGKTKEEVKQWGEASLLWAQEYFGKENIKAAIIHMDETSPHLQMIILPEWEGKLNAAHYTNGKKKMKELWTSYAKAMNPYGLKRGKEYSPAKHKSIKAYYADIQAGKAKAAEVKVKPAILPEPSLEDRLKPKEYAARLVNFAIRKVATENGNLRAALEATRRQLKHVTNRIATDRQLYWEMQNSSDMIPKLKEALKQEVAAKEKTQEEYNKLVVAVRDFFRRNIRKRDSLRMPEKLGSLADIPELKKDISFSLMPDEQTRQGMERVR